MLAIYICCHILVTILNFIIHHSKLAAKGVERGGLWHRLSKTIGWACGSYRRKLQKAVTIGQGFHVENRSRIVTASLKVTWNAFFLHSIHCPYQISKYKRKRYPKPFWYGNDQCNTCNEWNKKDQPVCATWRLLFYGCHKIVVNFYPTKLRTIFIIYHIWQAICLPILK